MAAGVRLGISFRTRSSSVSKEVVPRPSLALRARQRGRQLALGHLIAARETDRGAVSGPGDSRSRMGSAYLRDAFRGISPDPRAMSLVGRMWWE